LLSLKVASKRESEPEAEPSAQWGSPRLPKPLALLLVLVRIAFIRPWGVLPSIDRMAPARPWRPWRHFVTGLLVLFVLIFHRGLSLGRDGSDVFSVVSEI
jgi:hypothetical protein